MLARRAILNHIGHRDLGQAVAQRPAARAACNQFAPLDAPGP